MRCVIVVASTLAEPWISLRRLGQEPTWLKTCEFQTLHIVARPLGRLGRKLDSLHENARQHRIGRYLQRPFARHIIGRERKAPRWIRTHEGYFIDIPDTWFNGGWKTIALLEATLSDPDWDYFYGTTNGSYVNPSALQRVLKRLPSSRVYAGTPYVDRRETWLCGYSTLLSRDVAESIVESASLWDHSVHNDRAIGRLMQQLGVEPIELPHMALTSLEDVAILSDDDLKNIYNFRCKVPSDRSIDIQIMHALHARVLAIESQ